MDRSLQCTRNDHDECLECDCDCHDLSESKPWTWERFVNHARAHADMMQQAEGRTEAILKRMKHRGFLLRADEYGAVIQYNNACHCHPRMDEFTIPAQWLFADDWEVKVDEYMRGLLNKRLAAEADIQRQREAQERKDLERLQAKYRTA